MGDARNGEHEHNGNTHVHAHETQPRALPSRTIPWAALQRGSRWQVVGGVDQGVVQVEHEHEPAVTLQASLQQRSTSTRAERAMGALQSRSGKRLARVQHHSPAARRPSGRRACASCG